MIHAIPTGHEAEKLGDKLDELLLIAEMTSVFSVCENITLSKIKHNLRLHKLRLKLGGNYLKRDAHYDHSIVGLPDARQWYQLLSLWWLGSDVSPEKLKYIGQYSLDIARQKIDAMGGLDTEAINVSSVDIQKIKAAYMDAQSRVDQTLSRVMGASGMIDPVKIKKSELGMQFPAPGYYTDNTFYFNPLDNEYNLAQVDWLYLHEAVPGHHYQQSSTEW